MKPRVSVVVTAYNEGEQIETCLNRLTESISLPCEIIVVYDTPDDTTAPYVQRFSEKDGRVRGALNTYGRGPAKAIRYGFDNSLADVVVITMADGCDDTMQIDQMARLVERGLVIVAASRYMRGGSQLGGSMFKKLLSRTAGKSLYLLARVGTHDATNSFKAYSRSFVNNVGIESLRGFEVALELVSKARRHRLPVGEIPTIWLDREIGVSNFRLREWLTSYLRWYFYAYGPKIRQADVKSVEIGDYT